MSYDNGGNDGCGGREKEVICTRGMPYLLVLVLILVSYVAGMASGLFLNWWNSQSREEIHQAAMVPVLPDNFPRTYLKLEDAGHYDRVLMIRGAKNPAVPIKKDGAEYWPAFICLNSNCPGRKLTGGKPYIFAWPASEESMRTNPPHCPLCQEAQDKAPANQKADYHPDRIDRYWTEEAKAIVSELRNQYRRAQNATKPAADAAPNAPKAEQK